MGGWVVIGVLRRPAAAGGAVSSSGGDGAVQQLSATERRLWARTARRASWGAASRALLGAWLVPKLIIVCAPLDRTLLASQPYIHKPLFFKHITLFTIIFLTVR